MTQQTPQEWLVMLGRTAQQLDNVRELLRRMGRMGVGYRPGHNTQLRNSLFELAHRTTVLERNITRVSCYTGFLFSSYCYSSLELPRSPRKSSADPRGGGGRGRVSTRDGSTESGGWQPGCPTASERVAKEPARQERGPGGGG